MKFINLRGAGALVSTIGISTSFKLSRYPSRCVSDVPPLQSSVSDLRKEYSDKALLESDVDGNPYNLFTCWFDEACKSSVLEPNAMCLSTCKDNKPSARYVLLKGHDDRGFVWYTNYHSRKGGELDSNNNAALTFWWGEMERSIRIEGTVEKVSEEEATAYFHSRPRTSQLGAWSSNQSTEIESRTALEEQEIEIVKRFDNVEVIPKPPHWGGFRVIPNRMEFWKGRASRLHDRIAFTKAETDLEKSLISEVKWDVKRLQPSPLPVEKVIWYHHMCEKKEDEKKCEQ